MSYRITAVALWGLLVAFPGFAAEFEAGDPDEAEAPEVLQQDKPAAKAATKPAAPIATKKAANDVEEYGPWRVKVPAQYRGNTFKLRIGEEVLDLNKDEITLKGSDFREKVDLIDANGRLMSSDTIYVDPYIFDYVESRTWRISVYVGGVGVQGDGFRELLQDNSLQESSIDFEWQPSPVGLMLSLANQHSLQEHDFGVDSDYETSQTRLNATFEWVPMPRGNSFFRKVHMLTYVGVLASHDSIKISDDTVEIKDESSSTGAIVGNDFMFPIWRFWINVRLYASYHPIKFEDLDFEQKSVQHGALIGGSYAF